MMAERASPLDRAVAALREAESLVTMGHVGPDGDALGTSLAIALAARAAGKEAYATFGEPFVVPEQFRFLDQSVLVRPNDIRDGLDVAVACDTAAPDRLGSALSIALAAKQLIVLDHHRSNGGFGDIEVIDATAGATAQMAYGLLDRLDWPMTEDVALALYTGIVTDTGRFQYSSTSPEVHRVTAQLIEAGVHPELVGRHVYEESPFGYLHLAGTVLSRAQLDTDRKLVWATLYQQDLVDAAIRYEDADGLIDLIRIAKESEVACLLREVEPGITKGSLRSRGAVDVATIAEQLGGGGHHNAAGFTVKAPPEEVIEQVRERL